MFLLRKFKQWFHDMLIRKLIKDRVFSISDVNQDKRTIYCGLYSMNLIFLESKHELILAILQKWYKYKFIEQRFTFSGTPLFYSTKNKKA